MEQYFILFAMILAVLAGVILALIRENDELMPQLRRGLKVVFTVLVISILACSVAGLPALPKVEGWFFGLLFSGVAALVLGFLGYAAVIPRKMHKDLYDVFAQKGVNKKDKECFVLSYWLMWAVFFGFSIWGAFDGIVYIPAAVSIGAIAAIVAYAVGYIAVSIIAFLGKCLLKYWHWIIK